MTGKIMISVLIVLSTILLMGALAVKTQAWFDYCYEDQCVVPSPSPEASASPDPEASSSAEPSAVPQVTPAPAENHAGEGDGQGCATHDCSGNKIGSPASSTIPLPKGPPNTGKGGY